MKIRNGFVSNSSSSSFVIAFDKKPTHSYDVLEVMFPRQKDGRIGKGVVAPFGDEDEAVDALSAATLVWDQIKGQKPLTKKQIAEEISSGYFEGYPQMSYSSQDDPTWQIGRDYHAQTGKNIHDENADPVWKKKYEDAREKYWEDHRKAVDEAAKALMEKEFPKFQGKKCYRVSFSDNDGSVFATLEHGDTFKSLPHVRISHH